MALRGIRVFEIAGLAPAPFCGQILADFGANVVVIDRFERSVPSIHMSRGKRSLALDLKNNQGSETFLRLISQSDVVIEPFRAGVMEKLGLGPSVLHQRNPKLVIARLTGFGQSGANAKMAGHDINYLALSGALSLFGRSGENPVFPGNLLGDFAAGGMLCALGIVLALFERTKSGLGQVVDSAMVDGASYLSTFVFAARRAGIWNNPRGKNLLDSAAPFYDTYKTSDGKFVAVGAIEPQFYRQLIEGLGLSNDQTLPHQMDQKHWPQLKSKFAQIFASQTRNYWCNEVFRSNDACVSPVLELDEVMDHPHNSERNLLLKEQKNSNNNDNKSGDELHWVPSPAPRLSRTPPTTQLSPTTCKSSVIENVGQHTVEVLKEYAFTDDEIKNLLKAQAIAVPQLPQKASL